MNKVLNRELIRTMLGDFGLVPPPNFGKVGISTQEFLLKESLDMEVESESGEMESISYGLWAGSIMFMQSSLRVLATDICDIEAGYHEFVVTYRMDEAPIHAIKHVFQDDEDPGLFLRKNNHEWKMVSLYDRLVATAGFERLTSMGATWRPEKQYEDLYEALVEVVNM